MSEKARDDIFAPIEDDGWNTDDKCPWCGKLVGDEYVSEGAFDCPHCGKLIECEEWTQFILKRGSE
jgi:hypothetical protein